MTEFEAAANLIVVTLLGIACMAWLLVRGNVYLKERRKRKQYVTKDVSNASEKEKMEDLIEFVFNKGCGGVVIPPLALGFLINPDSVIILPTTFEKPEDKTMAEKKFNDLLKDTGRRVWEKHKNRETEK